MLIFDYQHENVRGRAAAPDWDLAVFLAVTGLGLGPCIITRLTYSPRVMAVYRVWPTAAPHIPKMPLECPLIIRCHDARR